MRHLLRPTEAGAGPEAARPIERIRVYHARVRSDNRLGGFTGLRWGPGFLTAVKLLPLLTVVAVAIGFVAKALTSPVDHPVFDAIRDLGTNNWTDVLSTLTKMGNVWQTQRLAAILAVALAVWFWRRKERWWMPFLVLPASWWVARLFQFGIAKIVDRDRDPISLLGTHVGAFPSGGVMRIIIVTAVAVFLAAHYGGISTRSARIGYVFAFCLGVAEAYFRGRLNQHWFTDIVSGLLIGPLFVGVVMATVRSFDPRPLPSTDDDPSRPAPDRSEAQANT
jgi:membrane-associated phospholipid phosphatase